MSQEEKRHLIEGKWDIKRGFEKKGPDLLLLTVLVNYQVNNDSSFPIILGECWAEVTVKGATEPEKITLNSSFQEIGLGEKKDFDGERTIEIELDTPEEADDLLYPRVDTFVGWKYLDKHG